MRDECRFLDTPPHIGWDQLDRCFHRDTWWQRLLEEPMLELQVLLLLGNKDTGSRLDRSSCRQCKRQHTCRAWNCHPSGTVRRSRQKSCRRRDRERRNCLDLVVPDLCRRGNTLILPRSRLRNIQPRGTSWILGRRTLRRVQDGGPSRDKLPCNLADAAEVVRWLLLILDTHQCTSRVQWDQCFHRGTSSQSAREE
jgi:hypothetical protein